MRPMSFQGMSYVLRWCQLCDRDYRRADEWSRGLERSLTLLMKGIVLRSSRLGSQPAVVGVSSRPLVMQCGRSCCVHRDAGPKVVSVEVPR